MGSSSSTSRQNITNTTSTFTTTLADSLNNALNTTQNFQNIGGYTPASNGGGAVNYALIFGAVILLFLVYFIFKKKKT